MARPARWIFAAAVLGMLAPATAAAEPAAGLNGPRNLIRFDTATPGDIRAMVVTGIQTPDEVTLALDTRPATGELFLITTPDNVVSGVSIVTRIYELNPDTGVATFVGALPGGSPPAAGDWPSGGDFSPAVDRIRVVNSNAENYRINPNNGSLAGDDANLAYAAPATGPLTAIAYDRNVAPGRPGTPAPPGTLTTAYGIDVGADRLVTIGGVDGAAPGGPNGGAVAAVGGTGALGVAVDNGSDAGLDISPGGAAYASLRTSGVPSLYTVDLATGAATLIGALPVELHSLTVLPPAPPPGDADADGVNDAADACPTLAGQGPDGCPLPPDETDPTITLSRTPSRVTFKRFLAQGVPVRIAPSEAVRLEVALLGRARAARIARAGDVVLAERKLGLSAAARSIRLRPARRLVGRPRRFRVRLRVIATDAAGNRAAVTKTIRVRRLASR